MVDELKPLEREEVMTNKSQRIYLDCPYQDKDECKALGARWDKEKRRWYVPANLSPLPFVEWMDDRQRDLVEEEYNHLEDVVEETGVVEIEEDLLTQLINNFCDVTDNFKEIATTFHEEFVKEYPLFSETRTVHDRLHDLETEFRQEWEEEPEYHQRLFQPNITPEYLAFMCLDDEDRRLLVN